MTRKAKIEDIAQVLAIYNANIDAGTASFEEEPFTYEEGMEWFLEHQGNYPLWVFESEGNIRGFATLSRYGHRRETAYRCAEVSIYVDQQVQGQGVGSRLMDTLIEEAKALPKIDQLISLITKGNQGSIALHEKKGFRYMGELTNVAQKYGHRLGLVFYQRNVE